LKSVAIFFRVPLVGGLERVVFLELWPVGAQRLRTNRGF
jgi:hypothetical protein